MKWKIKAMLFSTTNQLRGSLGLTPDASEKKVTNKHIVPFGPAIFDIFHGNFR